MMQKELFQVSAGKRKAFEREVAILDKENGSANADGYNFYGVCEVVSGNGFSITYLSNVKRIRF